MPRSRASETETRLGRDRPRIYYTQETSDEICRFLPDFMRQFQPQSRRCRSPHNAYKGTGVSECGFICTHELTFDELVVESQYLLKLQSGKITKVPGLVTANCRRQMSCCQSLDALSSAQSVTNAFGGRAPPGPAGAASALR